MTDQIRVRPVVRIGAIAVTLFTAGAAAICVVETAKSVVGRNWSDAGFGLLILGCMSVWALMHGRLIAIAGFTGLDRTADFYDGDDDEA